MKYSLSIVLMLITTAIANADQLFVIGQTKEGSFQGYEKGKFEFAPVKGRFMTVQATGVSKLVLTAPVKIAYQTLDSKDDEAAVLKGYDKSKFTLLKDEKEITVAQAKMKKIELAQEEGAGSKDQPDAYPIPAVNLDDFNGELTPEQQSAMDKFKAAKKAFDDFVAESSALVKQMDKATGSKREDFLNKLRFRKNDEQPLRKTLRTAYKTFVTAFPEQPDNAARKTATTKAPAQAQSVEPKPAETKPVEAQPAETKPVETVKTPEVTGVDTSPTVTTKPETKTIKINVDAQQPDKLVF